MISVYLEKLTDMLNFEYTGCLIFDEHTVYEDEVIAYLDAGNEGNSTPYDEAGVHTPTSRSKEYHIARVVWFVRHQDEIRGISVDNLCDNNHIYPTIVIKDGYHRFMAARICKMDKIKVEYKGREDVERYLQGRKKTPPKKAIR